MTATGYSPRAARAASIPADQSVSRAYRWPAGMAEPLSVDLRKRVVDAVKNGMSRRRAAALFRVGVSSAIRWTFASRRDRRPRDGLRSLIGGDRSPGRDDPLPDGGDARQHSGLQAAMAERGHRFSVSAIY
jgi:hypothetical protein